MRILYILFVICLMFSLGCNKEDNKIQTQPNNIKPLIKENVKVEKTDTKTENKIENKTKEKENTEKIKAQEVEELPLVKLDTNEVKLEWNDKSGKLMSALATNFSGNQKTNMLVLDNFTAILYENGIKSAKLKAKKAVCDISKKEIKILTGVKIESFANKSTLVANKLLWKSRENKIYAENGILNTTYGKIEGKYFIVDTALETFEINEKGLKIH